MDITPVAEVTKTEGGTYPSTVHEPMRSRERPGLGQCLGRKQCLALPLSAARRTGRVRDLSGLTLETALLSVQLTELQAHRWSS